MLTFPRTNACYHLAPIAALIEIGDRGIIVSGGRHFEVGTSHALCFGDGAQLCRERVLCRVVFSDRRLTGGGYLTGFEFQFADPSTLEACLERVATTRRPTIRVCPPEQACPLLTAARPRAIPTPSRVPLAPPRIRF